MLFDDRSVREQDRVIPWGAAWPAGCDLDCQSLELPQMIHHRWVKREYSLQGVIMFKIILLLKYCMCSNTKEGLSRR